LTKPRKTRPNGAAREDILAAATKLFADQGFSGVTLREIAQKARVHLPAIYNNFENKRMLYVACCINIFTRSTNEVAMTQRDDVSDEENILAFATEMARLNLNNPILTKLAQRQVLDNDKMLIDLVMQTATQGYYTRIIEIMTRLVGEEEASRLTFAITSLCFGSVQLSAYQQFERGGTQLTKVDSLTDFVLHVVMPRIDWAGVRKQRANRKQRVRA
jgi:AcrR family transcriptional regulator